MEMFVVFDIPRFCFLDSFASHLFRVSVQWNTIKKQGISRDLRSPSAIFCLVFLCPLTVDFQFVPQDKHNNPFSLNFVTTEFRDDSHFDEIEFSTM